ncbi:hypothetical protein [Marivirga arenosa]|jgi:hypothetical protein|uniref:Uncharacterized protein n=1 Tax=Marivirga arenosa TaxID=3059076 RepID=A0AA51RD08_9BACT|nr:MULTISPECIES: hypothetical protein [unclassified Marivirga]WMN06470.1 hypothetical protein QYS48_32660 [Marivirga sp. ABR2-2]WNB17186.1 hypothetical protein QYS47_33170 [Marivirga sp. BKB1-2]
MRVIGELPNNYCKTTLFQWNEKYLVKFELGLYEQTYKIDEYEVADVEELKSLISDEFIKKVMVRFDEMHKDWGSIALD